MVFLNSCSKHLFLIPCFYLALTACKEDEDLHVEYKNQNESTRVVSNEPIHYIYKPNNLDKDKVELGKRLFHEKQFSHNNTVSCASCHDLANGGDDGRKSSIGANKKKGELNAPTVFNAANNFRQFWDGRAANLQDQIDAPINNALEMGSNWEQIISKLTKDAHYLSVFEKIFPKDGITSDNIKECIVEFEKSLVTPSPFDRFLQGDTAAITATAKEGYRLFKSYGCISCHQGKNVGGNMYQKFGVMNDYFETTETTIKRSDYGRFNLTGQEKDRYVFKVPSLRNAAITAPYFHNGEVKTLSEAVKLMAKYQIGRSIPEDEVEKIVSFIHSLTGDSL